jgi:nitrate reductase NapD
MNISSVIVSARPGEAAVVSAGLAQLAGVEIHATTPEGKFIATIESVTDGETVHTFDRINALEGVMSVAMVYHQFESDPEREACK